MKVKIPGPTGEKIPPGGWTVFIPEFPATEKRVFNHKMLHLFVPQIQKKLTGLGLDPSTALERIHTHTANRLKREGHEDWVEGLVRRKRTLSEHWRGTKAYIRVKTREAKGQSILTLQKEAERRASICASGAANGRPCPQNLLVTESVLEAAENDKMAEMVEGRTTDFDELLGTCGACSCRLTTIVHLLPDVLMVDTMSPAERAKHPAICWKHQLKV